MLNVAAAVDGVLSLAQHDQLSARFNDNKLIKPVLYWFFLFIA